MYHDADVFNCPLAELGFQEGLELFIGGKDREVADENIVSLSSRFTQSARIVAILPCWATSIACDVPRGPAVTSLVVRLAWQRILRLLRRHPSLFRVDDLWWPLLDFTIHQGWFGSGCLYA